MQPMEFEQPLLRSPAGRALGAELCGDLLRAGRLLRRPRNSIVFQEGDPASAIFLVASGVLKLTRYTLEGREVIVHLAEPFAMVAEAALFMGKYPVTGVAVEDLVLIEIPRESVFALMESHPPFQRRLFDSMAHWLQRMVSKIEELVLSSATARLAHYLLDLSKQRGEKGLANVQRVPLPVKKGDLALLLNMNQATLSRTLRHLQDGGFIAVSGRTITILNPDGLRKSALPPLE